MTHTRTFICDVNILFVEVYLLILPRYSQPKKMIFSPLLFNHQRFKDAPPILSNTQTKVV